MTETTAINNIVRWLKYWDDRSKLLLINKISNTMLSNTKTKEETFFSCFGAYESEESAETLIDTIRANRTFRDYILI